MRRQTRMCCPPAAAALPPWPQAAADVLNRQRARHKAASLVRNRPTPSGSPESPRARGQQAGARACRRPGGRARRGLAPSFPQPVAGVERGPRRCPRASCAPLEEPAPRLPPAHQIAAVVGQLDKGGAQRRDARAQRRDERNTCPRGAEARQVPRAGLPRSTLRGSTPPGAPSPTGAYFGLRNRPGSAAENSARRRLSRSRAGAEWRRPPSPTGTGRLRRRRSA